MRARPDLQWLVSGAPRAVKPQLLWRPRAAAPMFAPFAAASSWFDTFASPALAGGSGTRCPSVCPVVLNGLQALHRERDNSIPGPRRRSNSVGSPVRQAPPMTSATIKSCHVGPDSKLERAYSTVAALTSPVLCAGPTAKFQQPIWTHWFSGHPIERPVAARHQSRFGGGAQRQPCGSGPRGSPGGCRWRWGRSTLAETLPDQQLTTDRSRHMGPALIGHPHPPFASPPRRAPSVGLPLRGHPRRSAAYSRNICLRRRDTGLLMTTHAVDGGGCARDTRPPLAKPLGRCQPQTGAGPPHSPYHRGPTGVVAEWPRAGYGARPARPPPPPPPPPVPTRCAPPRTPLSDHPRGGIFF